MIDDFAFPTTESRLITFQIGALCVNWSQIDGNLGSILGKYMKAPTTHIDIATSIVDLSRKCELIKAFSFLAEDRETYCKIEATLNFLDNSLRPVRNRYVHDSYSFFTGAHIRKIFRTRIANVQAFKKELLVRSEESVTAEEISEFNKDLDCCAMFLVYLLMRMIVDPEKAKPGAVDSLHRVGGQAYDDLSAVITKYKSRNRAS